MRSLHPQQRIRRRFATNYEQDVENQVMQFAETARAIASLPRDEWIRRFAVANLSGQPILSPEEGLMDKPLEKEGVIVEVDDYELGRIRQVGHTYGFDGVENPPIRPRNPDTEAPESIIDSWPSSEKAMSSGGADPEAPLSGVLVLDFGLAIAGPYGAQVLADLGADVIKITTLDFNLTDAIYVGSNHGKRALALNLKDPRGQEVARRLIVKADIVHHNMRRGVAERLGIGYLQVKELNPRIIYCHTRGYEMNGPRTDAPGNDQMGNALGGSEYEAGGTHHGTAPIWHTVSFGDAGNGVLSANACVQALYHREKTGLGQFVHTSILNVAMLFNSYTYVRPDGAIRTGSALMQSNTASRQPGGCMRRARDGSAFLRVTTWIGPTFVTPWGWTTSPSMRASRMRQAGGGTMRPWRRCSKRCFDCAAPRTGSGGSMKTAFHAKSRRRHSRVSSSTTRPCTSAAGSSATLTPIWGRSSRSGWAFPFRRRAARIARALP